MHKVLMHDPSKKSLINWTSLKLHEKSGILKDTLGSCWVPSGRSTDPGSPPCFVQLERWPELTHSGFLHELSHFRTDRSLQEPRDIPCTSYVTPALMRMCQDPTFVSTQPTSSNDWNQ